MALGGLIVLINPKSDILKIFVYALGFYGIWLGIEHCINLNHIHEVVHSENPFAGVDGCREIPIYSSNLPLHEWASGWFLPTGECEMDNPIVPEEAYMSLNAFQRFFVGTPPDLTDGLYSNGWYLKLGIFKYGYLLSFGFFMLFYSTFYNVYFLCFKQKKIKL